MVKIRIMGTIDEINWVTSILNKETEFKIIEISDTYSLKGSKRYFRTYVELEKNKK